MYRESPAILPAKNRASEIQNMPGVIAAGPLFQLLVVPLTEFHPVWIRKG